MSEHLPNPYSTEKETELYLSQIDNNGIEKIEGLQVLLEQGRIPKVDGKVRVLEVGVGSGIAIKTLSKRLSGMENMEYIGLDRSHLFAKNFRDQTNALSVTGYANKLPFGDGSLSAVNASAVFHEISSYGIKESLETVYGLEAVSIVVKEIARVLASGGVLNYRDVYCPDSSSPKEVKYGRESWSLFANAFLPRFITIVDSIDPALSRGFEISTQDAECSVVGTARLHREVQRHYLTFRDFMRRTAFPTAGLNVISEEWKSIEAGTKRHNLSLDLSRASWINDSVLNYTNDTNSFILDSNNYDDLSDTLIERYLKSNQQQEFNDWIKREGSEIYTYASLNEFSLINESVDLFELPGTRKLIPRNYYEQYLSRVIDAPEFEGKQVAAYSLKI